MLISSLVNGGGNEKTMQGTELNGFSLALEYVSANCPDQIYFLKSVLRGVAFSFLVEGGSQSVRKCLKRNGYIGGNLEVNIDCRNPQTGGLCFP